jgi:tetratricopeptide (TPR) repeat protein
MAFTSALRGFPTLRLLFVGAFFLATSREALAQRRLNFSRDIAPILFEHCVSCHRSGEIGSFSLMSYADVRPRASAIVRVTRTRAMPPWKPEPGYGGAFVGARRLTEQQIETIQRWVEDGAIEGDRSELPPLPAVVDGWRLGQPDVVLHMREPYALPAGGAERFRNFVIPIPVEKTLYVSGIEFRPGNARVVHHANLRIDRTRASRLMDEADPAPGYEGLTSFTAEFPDGHFLGWAPGQLPPPLADGMAWRLDPGSDLVLELHMRPGEGPEIVQASIGLFFTDVQPELAPLMIRLGKQNIDILPGATNHRIQDQYVLPVDVDVFALQPHAHFLAREIRGFAVLPDGTYKWLIFIRNWDFNWQDVYRYIEPLAMPKGTILTMEYTYDNSAANPQNRNRPVTRVRWGQNSSNEMGDLWIQVRARTRADRERLSSDFRAKALAEDAVGHEKLLEVEPDRADLHDNAALIYLSLGESEKAIAHLSESLRINPHVAAAHYNLGTALIASGRLDEALTRLRRALEIQPDYVLARVNLGAVLRSQQRFAAAIEAYRLAAAALATSGEFEKAAMTQEIALQIAESTGDAAAVGELRAQLEEYLRKSPRQC